MSRQLAGIRRVSSFEREGPGDSLQYEAPAVPVRSNFRGRIELYDTGDCTVIAYYTVTVTECYR